MKFSVHLLVDAVRDLDDLYFYVSRNDSAEKADRLIDNIEQTIMSLETLPNRGHYPPELERIGVFDFREIFFKPYRIMYEIVGPDVFVHCVLDGRRDLQDLLQQRMLR